MLTSRHTSLPLICRRDVLIKRHFLSLDTIKVLAVGAALHGVAIPEETAGFELGQQEVDNILEGLWEEDVRLGWSVERGKGGRGGGAYKVEAVDIGFFYPLL